MDRKNLIRMLLERLLEDENLAISRDDGYVRGLALHVETEGNGFSAEIVSPSRHDYPVGNHEIFIDISVYKEDVDYSEVEKYFPDRKENEHAGFMNITNHPYLGIVSCQDLHEACEIEASRLSIAANTDGWVNKIFDKLG